MRLIAAAILAVLGNVLGLLSAAHWIPGFHLSGDLKDLLVVALTLTILNSVLRPILKLFLGPLIVLTLGIGMIFVNAALLLLLDFLSSGLSIQDIAALLWSTLLIAAVNFLIHLFAGI